MDTSLRTQTADALIAALGREQAVEWAGSSRREPLRLNDILAPATARAILDELKASTHWERVRYVVNVDLQDHLRVNDDRFARASRTMTDHGDVQYSSAFVMDPHDMALGGALAELHAALSRDVCATLSRLAGIQLDDVGYVNATRMVDGDFLRAHIDHENNRVLGLLFYLADPDWTPGVGGELGYSSREGDRVIVPPAHNALSVMMLGRTGKHWVEPLAGPSFERFAVIAHFTTPC